MSQLEEFADNVNDIVAGHNERFAKLNDAKRAGRGVTRLFDESMDEGIRFRRRIEHGLGQAIERNELSLVYQPIVARNQLEVTGFEALVRWNTQEYGPISPATFIPIAEESNVSDINDKPKRGRKAVQ